MNAQKTLVNEKAKVFKALGHPIRLAMVEELAQGERCVCELVEMVKLDFSTVSRHLTILREAGIVQDDKRGQKVFYRLELPCIMHFMSCVETLLQAHLENRIAMLK